MAAQVMTNLTNVFVASNLFPFLKTSDILNYTSCSIALYENRCKMKVVVHDAQQTFTTKEQFVSLVRFVASVRNLEHLFLYNVSGLSIHSIEWHKEKQYRWLITFLDRKYFASDYSSSTPTFPAFTDRYKFLTEKTSIVANLSDSRSLIFKGQVKIVRQFEDEEPHFFSNISIGEYITSKKNQYVTYEGGLTFHNMRFVEGKQEYFPCLVWGEMGFGIRKSDSGLIVFEGRINSETGTGYGTYHTYTMPSKRKSQPTQAILKTDTLIMGGDVDDDGSVLDGWWKDDQFVCSKKSMYWGVGVG